MEYDRRFLFFFVGKFIPLEVTIDMLNGKKIVYQPDYLNLNSTLAKAFVNQFVLEVAFILFSYYQINHILNPMTNDIVDLNVSVV